MEREKKPKHFIQRPEYPGGPKEITKFIYENLRYPPEAVKAKIEGTVHLEYDIDFKGNVVDTRVIQGIGYGCDEEAARVLRMLKFIIGKNRGLRVLFHQKANIRFKLPKPVKMDKPVVVQPQMQVQYNYVTTTPTPATVKENKPKQPAATYSYTISYENKS